MKNLIHSLDSLAPFQHRVSHRAAITLLARQYVRENPIGSPQDTDAELAALYAAESHPFAPYPNAPAVCARCGGHSTFAHHSTQAGR